MGYRSTSIAQRDRANLHHSSGPVRANVHGHTVVLYEHPDGVRNNVEQIVIGVPTLSGTGKDDRFHTGKSSLPSATCHGSGPRYDRWRDGRPAGGTTPCPIR